MGLASALASAAKGGGSAAALLARAGFGILLTTDAAAIVPYGRDGIERRRLEGAVVLLFAGEPRSCPRATPLNHHAGAAAFHMDPRDRGEGLEPSVLKAQRSYEYIPHNPEL